jgi:NADPH:quinone reductase-like Zn-dependent oxidoreductase
MSTAAEKNLQIRSLLKSNGELEVSLVAVPIADPADDEVVVRIEATPLNPSDLGLLFGAADLSTARVSGPADQPVLTAKVPDDRMPSMAGRVDRPLPVGNEGAGVVVATGASDGARALQGKTVAVPGGAMYSKFRTVKAAICLPLPDGTRPSEGASCFINPLTALSMVETMRREGHTALVHTAAASNLGQMLNRICIEDGVKLVNVVRKRDQEDVLRTLGAQYVCNSGAKTFLADLTQAISATGATIAFDAIGGGPLVDQILTAMESVAATKLTEYSRYGSNTLKQVYIYGRLDARPTELSRTYGFAWAVGGFLLTPSLQKIGPAATQRLRERVVAGLKTTFASHYSRELSLAEALQPDNIREYAKFGTGAKVLINPSRS